MLTYLINVTGDLLTLWVVLGVTCAFFRCFCTERSQLILRIGLALGFAAAGVRAAITNSFRLTGGWRVGAYGYGAALGIFVLFLVGYVLARRRLTLHLEADRSKPAWQETAFAVVTGLLAAASLYGAVPNVYGYPFKFDTGGNGILSTDFLFRLGGYLLGILVCLVSFLAAYKLCDVAARKGMEKLVRFAFLAVNVLFAVFHFARLMLVLTPRKIVDSAVLFNFAAFSNNHAHWYGYACFGLLTVLAGILWVRSHTDQEPYATKAEHRKQRALWRTGKRYAVVLLVCFVVGILCATLFVQLNTVVIREAPVEDPVIVKDGAGADGELRVPLEMVSDGHLHRFGYTTDEGSPTRLIVVLKQENTNNYGVGLDACEICGEAGYYENNVGQVVCKKCGVVMNTTTIGMKGGCNPIIIDYDINESYITVPVEEMVKNQSRFKK